MEYLRKYSDAHVDEMARRGGMPEEATREEKDQFVAGYLDKLTHPFVYPALLAVAEKDPAVVAKRAELEGKSVELETVIATAVEANKPK